jgi:hypothetical protein
MPFELSSNTIVYHQNKDFSDKTRIKYIVDAMVYIAALYDKPEI